jgi:hypothetical protein
MQKNKLWLNLVIAAIVTACATDTSSDSSRITKYTQMQNDNAEAAQERKKREEDSIAAAKYAAMIIETDTIDQTLLSDIKPLLGYYVGKFEAKKYKASKNPMYSNKINISIDSINGTYVIGHSVVAGGMRPFIGKITKALDGTVKFVLHEPGTDKYDGVFTAQLDIASKKIKGQWSSYDTSLAVTVRSFDLSHQTFSYQPHLEIEAVFSEVLNSYNAKTEKFEAITEDAGKYNASIIELKPELIENFYKWDLEIMRNAIYARHGYSFKNRKVRFFFDDVDWYIPVSIDVTKELTELEKKNIALIKRYEKHAEVYYDAFGR